MARKLTGRRVSELQGTVRALPGPSAASKNSVA
jgi:hypothetical protein